MIRFKKDMEPVSVEVGDNLMGSLLAADRPVASSCYGRGICSKCRMIIVEGAENLSKASKLENELKAKHQLAPNVRISCQTSVNGDVTVDTPYW